VGHVVHSGASRARNIDTLFFMLKWAQCGFHKKRARTCYNKLVFLLLVGSAGQIMHSRVFGARNLDVLFFMLRWTGSGFKHVFLHSVGSAGHIVHSGASRPQNVDTLFHPRVGLVCLP
jgi:hypothetical protein